MAIFARFCSRINMTSLQHYYYASVHQCSACTRYPYRWEKEASLQQFIQEHVQAGAAEILCHSCNGSEITKRETVDSEAHRQIPSRRRQSRDHTDDSRPSTAGFRKKSPLTLSPIFTAMRGPCPGQKNRRKPLSLRRKYPRLAALSTLFFGLEHDGVS